MPRVFSYVVAADGGFAPNPFHGWCTLACCKPKVRKSARKGDLIVGLSRKCERLVYIMRVAEKLTFEEYWKDPRFQKKKPSHFERGKPDWTRHSIEKNGDNIYEPDGRGGFRQLKSAHWDHAGDQESISAKEHDTWADAVLVTRDFVYFGGDGPEVGGDLSFLFVTRGHRCRFTPEQVAVVSRYFDQLPRGRRGVPGRWAKQDDCRPSPRRRPKASCA
jgi:hypothetical protein